MMGVLSFGNIVGKSALGRVKRMHPPPLALCRERGASLFMYATPPHIFIGFIFALENITAFNAALLHPTIPVFAAVIGVIIGVEVLNRPKVRTETGRKGAEASWMHASFALYASVGSHVRSLTGGPFLAFTSQAMGIGLCAVGSFIVTVWGVTADETEGASNLVLGRPPPLFIYLSMATLLKVAASPNPSPTTEPPP